MKDHGKMQTQVSIVWLDYFLNLFASNGCCLDIVIRSLKKKILYNHNDLLNQPFMEEQKKLVLVMHPNKALWDD